MSEPGSPDIKLAATADASATLALAPTRSQIILGVLAILSAFIFGLSVYLFVQGKEYAGYSFLIVGALLTAAILWAWSKSHTNQDLEGSQLKIQTNDGLVSVDARVLDRLSTMQEFWNVLERIFSRQPIPVAAGVTDVNMGLTPNSENEAAQRVSEANVAAARACEAIVQLVPAIEQLKPVIQSHRSETGVEIAQTIVVDHDPAATTQPSVSNVPG